MLKTDKAGRELPEPMKEWDHLMDAMRYAMKDSASGTEFVNLDTQREIPADSSREVYKQRLREIMARRNY